MPYNLVSKNMRAVLTGIDGSFSAGQRIDIVGKSRRVPLGFMSHFEAHYERYADSPCRIA